jgi:Chaperone of endosialidase
MDSQRQQQISSAKGGLISGLAGIAGAALMPAAPVLAAVAPAAKAIGTSDKRVKKDIKATTTKASRELDKMAGSGSENRKFLDALQSYEYKYKHEGKDASPQMGIMAQDLEKTRLGKQMVVENELGVKQVDFGRGFGALLASQAELNKRIKKLEAAKGRIA